MNRNIEVFEKSFVYSMLLIITVLCLFPVVWMCVISFKDTSESISGFDSLVIRDFTFGNFERLFNVMPVWNNMFNSLFTTLIGTLTSVFFCALAGFAFAKYNFPGRNFLFYFLIATMLVPAEVGAIPLFLIMKKLKMINSLWSLIIPRIATAIGIFYMRQYIKDMPTEILEASRIDGCGDFRIFTSVVIPIIKPALASWGMLTLIARWNDFFWPLLFLRNTRKYTMIVSISLLPVSDGLSTPWPVIMAGTTMIIVPIIVLYLLLQCFQKEGLTLGAVKG